MTMLKSFFGEFKQFIARGNVIDMAVGIIMGTAFTGIVNSLVQGIFMPGIGYLINGISFTDLRIILKPAIDDTAEVAIMYGSFIQQIINFLIISCVAFIMVKLLNKLYKKKDVSENKPAEAKPAVPEPAPEIILLTEIRDLLQRV